MNMKESDLYPPLKRFLESQRYEVKGEIGDCDVLAVRGAEAPVVVELKLSLNLNVVLQAVERLSLTPKVYIGVPKRCSVLSARRKHVVKLLRMLGLGSDGDRRGCGRRAGQRAARSRRIQTAPIEASSRAIAGRVPQARRRSELPAACTGEAA